jgi:ornithine cyclodeaminase
LRQVNNKQSRAASPGCRINTEEVGAILVLTRNDIQKAVSMIDAIDAVGEAFRSLSKGETAVPLRTPVPVPENNGVALFMPGFLPAGKALGLKAISVFPDNPAKGIPTINAVFLLMSPETGEPLALMEANYLTALRTGAASGLATRHLAKQETPIVAVFGAGAQARTQLEAVHAVREISEVRVFDLHPAAVEKYIKDMKSILTDPVPAFSAAATPETAVADADVIITATTSTQPVFNGSFLKTGAHINGVGSYTPQMREIDLTALQRADKIVVDAVSAALEEAGDLIIPLTAGQIARSDIYGEIGEVAAGLMPGRESDSEITIFKTVGHAVQDLAVARLIYERASRDNLGTIIELL